MKSKKNKLKITVCMQARMGSKRLPKKALLKIGGKTIINTIFDRLKSCREIDNIILSTSLTKENDILIKHADEIGLKHYRGSESDLISRHLGAVLETNADAFVKITGDCPLADPKLIDQMVKVYRDNYKKIDLMTNCFPPTYPDGLDIDIIPRSVLEKLDKEIRSPFYREYFVSYIMENPKKFKIYNLKNSADYSFLRWTLDYPEDMVFIKKIFKALGQNNKIFCAKDILEFLKKNPELKKINEKRIDKVIVRNIRSGVYHSLLKNNK